MAGVVFLSVMAILTAFELWKAANPPFGAADASPWAFWHEAGSFSLQALLARLALCAAVAALCAAVAPGLPGFVARRVGRNRVTAVVFLAAIAILATSQLRGREFGPTFGTLAGGMGGPGMSESQWQEEVKRRNTTFFTWVHGWPWHFLIRGTTNLPVAAPGFDPADASPWALTRGVRSLDPLAFLADAALCAAMAALCWTVVTRLAGSVAWSVGRNKVTVVVFLMAIAILTAFQLRGREEERFARPVTVTGSPGESSPGQINLEYVTYVHGWPWLFLKRVTTFWPANDPGFDSVDASPWAFWRRRGVPTFSLPTLLADAACCVALAAVAAGLAALVVRGVGRKESRRL